MYLVCGEWPGVSGSLSGKGCSLSQGMQQHNWLSLTLRMCYLLACFSGLNASTGRHGKGTFTGVTAAESVHLPRPSFSTFSY